MNRLLLTLVLAISLPAISAHAQLIPISVTGYNFDVIYGGGADGTNGDVAGGSGGYQYMDQTFANAQSYGVTALPNNRTVTTSTATFQFQPYTANNDLVVRGADQTLTLSAGAQGSYQQIGFLLNNITFTSNQVQSFTFNFSDSTSDTVTTAAIVPYWVGGNPSTSTSTQFAAVGLQVSPLTFGNGTSGNDGTPIQFDEYDFVLSAADQGKTLTSITVVGNGSTNAIDVYAVSGLLAAPEPSTWAMLFTGAGLLIFALRRRAQA